MNGNANANADVIETTEDIDVPSEVGSKKRHPCSVFCICITHVTYRIVRVWNLKHALCEWVWICVGISKLYDTKGKFVLFNNASKAH